MTGRTLRPLTGSGDVSARLGDPQLGGDPVAHLGDVADHADLDTLFVDEGFGSLDADTLDSLRDGGRVVGVVSHVAEMRDRIPTQLRVHKHRQHGSSVESVLA